MLEGNGTQLKRGTELKATTSEKAQTRGRYDVSAL